MMLTPRISADVDLQTPPKLPSLPTFFQQTHDFLCGAFPNLHANKSIRSPIHSNVNSTLSYVDNVHLILGNESCDLDSMACATVLAWYLSAIHCSINGLRTVFVPVFNCPRKYFALRNEAAFLFSEAGVDANNMVFFEDIDWNALKENDKLRIILVDHNELTESQSFLSPYVIGIVDHHLDAQKYLDNTQNQRFISHVGSCSSLVAKLIHDAFPNLLRSSPCYFPIVNLLTAAIVIDTHNFSEEVKKTTPTDRQIIQWLTEASLTYRFEDLSKKKGDVSKLNSEQLIARDAKNYRIGPYHVLISTLPIGFDIWRNQCQSMSTEIERASADVAAYIMLTSYTHPVTHEYIREVALVVKSSIDSKGDTSGSPTVQTEEDPHTVDNESKPLISPKQLFEVLVTAIESSKLEVDVVHDELLAPSALPSHLTRRWKQRNLSKGRKYVAPLVVDTLSKL